MKIRDMRPTWPSVYVSVFAFIFFAYIQPVYGAVFGVSKPNPSSSLNSGLVGYWTFDGKNMTTNVADSSGNGYSGRIVGQTSTTTALGKVGQALYLDGQNDYVSFSLTPPSKPYTLTGWVYSDGTQRGSIVSLANYTGNTNANYYATIGIDSDGKARAAVQYNYSDPNANVRAVVSSASIANKWTFVAATFSGANYVIDLYVNGVYESSYSTFSAPTFNTVSIGRVSTTTAADYLRGYVDDVRIYNRALSASEVLQLYNQGKGGKIASSKASSTQMYGNSLIGYWNFDGKNVNWSTNKANDTSGYGNNASIVNMATTTSPILGKLGQALNFDGIDDYVETSAATLYDITGTSPVTVSAWVKSPMTAAPNTINIVSFTETGNNSSTYEKALLLSPSPSKFAFYVWDGTTHYSYSNAVNDTNWHYLSGVYDGTNVYLYVDGVLQSSPTTATGSYDYTSPQILIGGHYLSMSYYKGNIDDVRIYNRVLSGAEIRQAYAQSVGNKTNISKSVATSTLDRGLVGYWTFDGKDMIPNVRDVSVSANHGYLTVTATSSTIGKVGQALYFNGSQRVNLGSNPLSSYSTPHSACAWVVPYKTSGTILQLTKTSNVDEITLGLSTVLQIGFSAGGVTYGKNATGAIPLYQWSHLCYSFNGSAVALYVNGVSSALTTSLGAQGQTGNMIGQRGTFGGANWHGIIDDVRVYNRELSASEVLQLYNRGK